MTTIVESTIDWRVPVGTAIAAGAFALAERASAPLAKGVAWIALLTVLFSRVNPRVPSPAESLLSWWNGGGPPGQATPQPGTGGGTVNI